MKHLALLGSTGSIGTNVLNIVEMFPQEFNIKVLAAKKNISLLVRQIERFQPEVVAVFDEARAKEVKDCLPPGVAVDLLYGDDGYCDAAAYAGADLTVTAMVGAAGLKPTLAAIDAGKTIALANKETLVMAGDFVMEAAAGKGIQILPIDSEHSAIFQCLHGQRKEDMDRILLTASGGPFLNKPRAEFKAITRDDALKHPNWQMGAKITIDSATLMNKGLEVLEARCLFGVSHEMIEVVIHPQSIIHSMVAFKDGSVMAQLGIPDMKGAIAYALSYPQRLPIKQPLPKFNADQTLSFQEPDLAKFPCLAMAFEACETGGSLPAVLNAANEVAVNGFLKQEIGFVDIAPVIRQTLDQHTLVSNPGLPDILAADDWARGAAREVINDLRK